MNDAKSVPLSQQNVTVKKNSLRTRIVYHKYMYIMLLPTMVYFIIFKYLPMYGIQLAFKDHFIRAGIWGSPWIGLENFRMLFNNIQFMRAFRNTIIISVGRILFTFAVPVFIALLLNEIRHLIFKKVIQLILYLPHFLSWVIISGMMYGLLSVNGGVINKIIEFFGGEPIAFLLKPDMFRPLIYISIIWKEMGWSSIIYLAALSSINPELYEAAIVDGANRFRQMVHITWPGIKSTVVIMLILATANIMNAGFNQIFNLYSPSVYSTGDIIDTMVYREFFLNGEFGVGTAADFFKAVIGCLLIFSVNKIAKKLNEGQGLY